MAYSETQVEVVPCQLSQQRSKLQASVSKSLFDLKKLLKSQDENYDGPSSDDVESDVTTERASDSCDT